MVWGPDPGRNLLYVTQYRCLRKKRPSQPYEFIEFGAMDVFRPSWGGLIMLPLANSSDLGSFRGPGFPGSPGVDPEGYLLVLDLLSQPSGVFGSYGPGLQSKKVPY